MVCGIYLLATSLPSTFSDARATFAETGTVVGEVEDDRVLAGRERLLALPPEALEVEQVLGEHRLALEQIETVAAEAAALA